MKVHVLFLISRVNLNTVINPPLATICHELIPDVNKHFRLQ